ncbi:O-antigen ligase family protein [Niallia taxi]|uniref:O-antigen ligase family protein n=1 Tax=Niallia taxi TaxID=2499688 RepID=UPI0039819EC2
MLVFVLILIISNVPPIEALPSFKLLETPIGIISVPRFLLLMLLVVSIITIFRYKSRFTLTLSDLLMYLLVIMITVNYEQASSAFYFCLIFVGGYLIGRLLKLINNKNNLYTIIKIAGFIQVLLVLYSMYISPFDFAAVEGRDVFRSLSNKIEGGSIRASGTIGHPVVLGAILLPSALCWFFSFLKTNKKIHKFLYLTAFLITTYCIIQTFSRGTWIALIAVLFYLFVKQGFIKRVKTWFVIIISIIGLILSPIGTSLLARFSLLSNTSDGSVSHRVYMYYWSVKELLKNPITFLFGNGVGSSGTLLEQNPPPDFFLVVDNTYLTFMVEMGIIGICFLLIIIFRSIYKMGNVSAFGYIILALSFVGLTFDLYYWEQISIIYWILVGYETTREIKNNSIK